MSRQIFAKEQMINAKIRQEEIQSRKTYQNNKKDKNQKYHMNLMELRRRHNEKEMEFKHKYNHIKKLYDLEQTRQKAREFLSSQKPQEEQPTFKPQLNQTSENMMQNKKNQIERCEEWNKLKKERNEKRRELHAQQQFEDDLQNTQQVEPYDNHYVFSVSKVKLYIDTPRAQDMHKIVHKKKKFGSFKNLKTETDKKKIVKPKPLTNISHLKNTPLTIKPNKSMNEALNTTADSLNIKKLKEIIKKKLLLD